MLDFTVWEEKRKLCAIITFIDCFNLTHLMDIKWACS